MKKGAIYFTRRIESFIGDGIEPPSHLRTTIKCDICDERCWANKDNWNNMKRFTSQIACDQCFRLGRHRTG